MYSIYYNIVYSLSLHTNLTGANTQTIWDLLIVFIKLKTNKFHTVCIEHCGHAHKSIKINSNAHTMNTNYIHMYHSHYTCHTSHTYIILDNKLYTCTIAFVVE